jgi:excisionase family DNA binding protein
MENDTRLEPEPDFVIQPREAELKELRELQASLQHSEPKAIVLDGGKSVALPPAAVYALRLASEYLARNLAIAVEPYSQLLTTQRVADLLKVSRPTVVELLKRGAIGSTTSPGGHRRVRLTDAVAYQQRTRQNGTVPATVAQSSVHSVSDG